MDRLAAGRLISLFAIIVLTGTSFQAHAVEGPASTVPKEPQVQILESNSKFTMSKYIGIKSYWGRSADVAMTPTKSAPKNNYPRTIPVVDWTNERSPQITKTSLALSAFGENGKEMNTGTSPTGSETLYRKTLNRIKVFTPSDAESYRLESSTGKMVKGTSIELSPSGESVVLRIFSEGQYLGKKRYEVVDPPLPRIRAFNASGHQVQCGGPLPRARPTLKFEVDPDSFFASKHPEDTNYRVREAEVEVINTLENGKPVPLKVGKDGILREKLIRLFNQIGVQHGDLVHIRLEVIRVNHEGEAIRIDPRKPSLNFRFRIQ